MVMWVVVVEVVVMVMWVVVVEVLVMFQGAQAPVASFCCAYVEIGSARA